MSSVIEKKAGNFLIVKEDGVETGSGNWIGGSVTLTSEELQFRPNGLNAMVGNGGSGRDVRLEQVSAIAHQSAFGTDIITVETPASTYQFRCYGAKQFADVINGMVAPRGEQEMQRATDPTVPEASLVQVAATRPQLVDCETCGHPISPKASRCPACNGIRSPSDAAEASPGFATPSGLNPTSSGKTPEEIRENLRRFESHHELSCLECGYKGLMGVKANVTPWYASWVTGGVFVLFVVVYFTLFRGGGLFAGAVAALCFVVLRNAVISQVLTCPSCESDLEPTS